MLCCLPLSLLQVGPLHPRCHDVATMCCFVLRAGCTAMSMTADFAPPTTHARVRRPPGNRNTKLHGQGQGRRGWKAVRRGREHASSAKACTTHNAEYTLLRHEGIHFSFVPFFFFSGAAFFVFFCCFCLFYLLSSILHKTSSKGSQQVATNNNTAAS